MNIVNSICQQADQRPHQRAVVYPVGRDLRNRVTYSHYTFSQLNHESDYLAYQLRRLGLKPGTKVLLFVRPSLEFSLISFSLFKVGAVPILIDPGMGKKNLIHSIRDVQPEWLIAVPEVHKLRIFMPSVFQSVRTFISTGVRTIGKTLSLHDLLPPSYSEPGEAYPVYDAREDEQAAIIFTSGGTGKPKGVVYTHKTFCTQLELLQKLFKLTPDDRDLPGFPLFSLFTMGMGATSFIPDMDPSKPAMADPVKLVESIKDHSITFAAGSPAIWERVGRYCLAQGIELPSVRVLAMFGAPVRSELHEMFKPILVNGTTHTPYGATECLPVSNINAFDLIGQVSDKSASGAGTCIGKVVEHTEIRVVKPLEGPMSFEQMQDCEVQQRGEIVVCGDQVTPKYFRNSKATNEAKITDPQGRLWHRMGDMGYFDEQDRLWFCGRKAHRVYTEKDAYLDPIPVEAAFINHPEVAKAALIGLRNKKGVRPAVVIERKDQRKNLPEPLLKSFKNDLKTLARNHSQASEITSFFLYPKLPVDTRHNIKIDRKKLSEYFSGKESKQL